MHYQAVRRVLMSPAYVARPTHGVEDVLARPVGNWPAIVDDETWRRVRANVAGHQRLPRQASQSHLLTGLVRCPACGSRMHGRTRIKRGRVYACGSRNRGADTPTWACNYQALGEPVEDAVLAQIAPVIEAAAALPNLQELLRLHWERLRGRSSDLAEFNARRVQQLEQAAARATERLTKAAVLYADGDIDKIGYELLRDKARDDLAAAEAGLAGLVQPDRGPDLPPFEAVVAEASGWSAILREGDTAAVRQVVAALVDRIVPVRLGTGHYAVEIAWTDAGEALRLLADFRGGAAGGVADEPRIASLAKPGHAAGSFNFPYSSVGVSRSNLRMATCPADRGDSVTSSDQREARTQHARAEGDLSSGGTPECRSRHGKGRSRLSSSSSTL